jgi:protein-disulfide isomerase
MSKDLRDNPGREGPMIRRSSTDTTSLLLGAAVAGIAILLFINFQNWADGRGFRESMNERLGSLETRITQLSAKVDALPAAGAVPAAAPPPRGPDPNKVYTVKTNGRPSKGPDDAPITIAEFSDFQ